MRHAPEGVAPGHGEGRGCEPEDDADHADGGAEPQRVHGDPARSHQRAPTPPDAVPRKESRAATGFGAEPPARRLASPDAARKSADESRAAIIRNLPGGRPALTPTQCTLTLLARGGARVGGRERAFEVPSMKRPPVSSDSCLYGVPLLPAFHVSGPRRLIHGSREVRSSFYSRSSVASAARRRMRGVEGWGRHLRNGSRTAAKEFHALTHPSNLRETMVPLIARRTVSDFPGFGAPIGCPAIAQVAQDRVRRPGPLL